MPQTPKDTDPGSFARRYARGDLSEFFALQPGALEQARAAPRPVDRGRLAAALRLYASRLGAPQQVFASLERLTHPESRAVVTGQQAGLLLGPLYTLSKAATALKLAKDLDREERPVVPVFWVASQDHDSHEVDHAYLLDLDERLTRVELPLPAGTPSGRIPFDPSWTARLGEQLAGLNFEEARREEMLGLIERASDGAKSYADWFAKLLLLLFGEHGLVVLDPLEPGVAELFAPVLQRELADPAASSRAINEAGSRLLALGIAPQLGRAEGATNLFLEDEGGQRHLLRYDGRGFSSGSGSYSQAELEAVLRNEPSRLTPAAGLRPITQDRVLPTAVTVVGPGELRYFAQLKGVYERHEVAMPLVWPRASVTVLEPPARRILDKFGLSAEEVTADFEGVRARALLELHGHGRLFSETLGDLGARLERLQSEVRGIDPTLEGTVLRAGEHFERTLELLRHKSARALAEQDDTYARQFERLGAHLLPLGQPQERVLSPFSFFLKFGVQPLLAALLALPSSGEHVIRF